MRRLLLISLLAIAGCGAPEREPETSSEDLRTFDSADTSAPEARAPSQRYSPADAAAGPDVSPTAAPGVAFNYRYAFRLPADRIAQVQEEHAQACEQLGVARCRITGMRYRVVNERDIEAMLAFKLDPMIARRFGRAGVEAVGRAEGMLIESEITGTDVGTSIRAAGRSIAEMNEELARIERRLAQSGVPQLEREQLQIQAQQLRQSIRAARDTREEQQESLANTPMVFHYGSGALVPGGDRRPSFTAAAERGWNNLLDGLVVLFIVVITLLPWVLLALLVWWGVRKARAWFAAREARAAEPRAG